MRLRIGHRTFYGSGPLDLAANIVASLTGHRWER